MRFLLDENVPLDLARALAARGHDAATLAPEQRSGPDEGVLALAAADRRVLVTLDKDFGELVFLAGAPPPPAVVLIRLRPVELATRIGPVAAALEQALDADGLFVVVGRDGVRVRRLPGSGA